jgi:predicted RNase H-like nuclease (RuvC/YqgF family)
MSQPDFNPFDPVSAAMGAMHGQNLLAAKDARIKQLEADVERMTDEIQVYKEGVTKSDNLFKSIGIHVKDEEWVADGITQLITRIRQLEERLEGMREAGDELWYCVRHAQRIDADALIEAIEDWQEARNHA